MVIFISYIHDQITNLYLSRCKKPLLFVASGESQTKQVMTCPLPQADLPAVSLRIFIPLSSSCFLFHLELLLLHLFRQDADSRVKNIRCAAECPCEPPPLPQCKVSQTQLCRQKRRSRPPVRGVSFTPPPPAPPTNRTQAIPPAPRPRPRIRQPPPPDRHPPHTRPPLKTQGPQLSRPRGRQTRSLGWRPRWSPAGQGQRPGGRDGRRVSYVLFLLRLTVSRTDTMQKKNQKKQTTPQPKHSR